MSLFFILPGWILSGKKLSLSDSLSLSLSIYIHMYIHICICTYEYIHIYIYVCTHTYTYSWNINGLFLENESIHFYFFIKIKMFIKEKQCVRLYWVGRCQCKKIVTLSYLLLLKVFTWKWGVKSIILIILDKCTFHMIDLTSSDRLKIAPLFLSM